MENFEKFYSNSYKHPQTRKQLIKSLNFEKKFYNKVIKILSKKFNKIFFLNENIVFWDKILGSFIYFHITQTYNFYNSCIGLKLGNKRIIIRKPDYYIPDNLEDYRNYFQRSLLGIKQLYSIFYYKENKNHYEKNQYKIIKKFKDKFNRLRKFHANKTNRSNLKNIFFKIMNEIYRNIKKPTILAFGVYWTEQEKVNVNFLMKGRLLISKFMLNNKSSNENYELRNSLFFFKLKSNKFESFFFESLKYSAPKSIVEDLILNIKNTEQYASKYPEVKYFLNENLSEGNLFLNAVLGKIKVKTIYIQHNFISHIYLSNQINFILKKFDKYYNFGWQSIGNKKIVRAASLFNWIPLENKKPFNIENNYILFVPTQPLEIMHYTSGYFGECGKFFAEKYISTEKKFIDNLSHSIKKNLIYKTLPKSFSLSFENSYENIIFKYLKSKNIRVFESNKFDVENYFAESKLIIISYMATAYLQALHSNKPTVIFFSCDSYFLKNKFLNYFDELIDAKILHLNPKSAAKFVNSIQNNVEDWWLNKKTITARKKFLKKNFLPKSILYKKLLQLKNH
jgi:putative transferase (TIGR04331 family)